MQESKKNQKNKVLTWIREHSTPILIIASAVLILLTLKTQSVVVSDGGDVKARLDYSLFGYCLRLAPMTDAADALSAADIYLLNSIDSSVQKAAHHMTKENKDKVIEIYVSGFPKNNETLSAHLVQLLQAQGITAKIIEV